MNCVAEPKVQEFRSLDYTCETGFIFFDRVDDCLDRGSFGLKEERSLFYVLADFGPVEIKLGGHQFDL